MVPLLEGLGVQCVHDQPWPWMLLVGNEGDYGALDRILETKIEQKLKQVNDGKLMVYSQEMMLCWLFSGKDPHKNPSLLKRFGMDHEALKYLLKTVGFLWPGNRVPDKKDGEACRDFDWSLEEGPLSFFGYHVGKVKGLQTQERRQKLRLVFELPKESMPILLGTDFADTWSQARSQQRLEAMVNAISGFRNRAGGKRVDMEQAIREWEDDLEFLRDEYWLRFMATPWPHIRIRQIYMPMSRY